MKNHLDRMPKFDMLSCVIFISSIRFYERDQQLGFIVQFCGAGELGFVRLLGVNFISIVGLRYGMEGRDLIGRLKPSPPIRKPWPKRFWGDHKPREWEVVFPFLQRSHSVNNTWQWGQMRNNPNCTLKIGMLSYAIFIPATGFCGRDQ